MRFIKLDLGTKDAPRLSIVSVDSIVGVFRFDGQHPSLQTTNGNYPLTDAEADAIIEQLG